MYIRNQQVFISLLTHLNGTQTEFTDIENAKLLLPIINLDLSIRVLLGLIFLRFCLRGLSD